MIGFDTSLERPTAFEQYWNSKEQDDIPRCDNCNELCADRHTGYLDGHFCCICALWEPCEVCAQRLMHVEGD